MLLIFWFHTQESFILHSWSCRGLWQHLTVFYFYQNETWTIVYLPLTSLLALNHCWTTLTKAAVTEPTSANKPLLLVSLFVTFSFGGQLQWVWFSQRWRVVLSCKSFVTPYHHYPIHVVTDTFFSHAKDDPGSKQSKSVHFLRDLSHCGFNENDGIFMWMQDALVLEVMYPL